MLKTPSSNAEQYLEQIATWHLSIANVKVQSESILSQTPILPWSDPKVARTMIRLINYLFRVQNCGDWKASYQADFRHD